MEIITNTFPKSPGDIRLYAISFSEALEVSGDTLSLVNPFELGDVPEGLIVESYDFDVSTARVTLLVSGGVDGKYYPLKMYVNTSKGQRIEHLVYFKVRQPLYFD